MKRIVVHEDVLMQELPTGEAAVLHIPSETFFSLDVVGRDVWEALTSTDSVEAAVEELLGTYDADPRDLRRDVDEFVDKLSAADLVSVED